MFDIHPLTLEGNLVRLEPMREDHVPDLAAVGCDDSIWQFMRYGMVRTEDQMRKVVRDLLADQARGTDLCFTVMLQASSRAIGMTRYMHIEPENRSLEIGGTWYGVAYQRTAANTECKYLLLRHAFERLGCIRVQIKTDLLNVRSQVAIERIGAVREGVLRDHWILPDGRIRSSVYYSILAAEWPAVRDHLLALLARPA